MATTTSTMVMPVESRRIVQKASADASENTVPDMKALREAIPAHCFQPSLLRSLSYVARDLVLVSALFFGASYILALEPSIVRTALIVGYGFLQGCVFTGIWILAHECGHDAFSLHRRTNAVVGFVLHSILLVPFFSWKFSHARHHRYANNMEKDTVFVPSRKDEWRKNWLSETLLGHGHGNDTPIVSLLLLVGHQLVGWPYYILTNAGAGAKSLVGKERTESSRQSHLDPGAHLWTAREAPFVLLSNIGLVMTWSALWFASTHIGAWNVFLMYGVPYLWMNHWIVAITYLHHTHPEKAHFEDSAWTYQKGALSTIDRDFGWIGEHLFHGIIEYHAIHHLFSKIPFYHAKEATEAIAPLLGKQYIQERGSFIGDLWKTFASCNYVVKDGAKPGELHWAKHVVST